jgi:hypothetical protein
VVTRTGLAKIVFGLGAVVSAAWAIYNLRALAQMYEAGAGGGGFITSMAIDVLEYVAPAALAFWLATRVRHRSGSVRYLRRAHQLTSFAIVLLAMLLVAATFGGAFTSGVDGLWRGVLFGAFIGAAMWLPVQVFFVAAFVALLIEQRASRGAIER